MILLIDNYDSFTYNLVQFLGSWARSWRCGATTRSRSKRSPQEARAHRDLARSRLPENAGICIDVIKRFAGQMPILGVCLGHQAIGQAFGGKRDSRAGDHARQDQPHPSRPEEHFPQAAAGLLATRYHSLIVERKSLPKDLEISAETEDGLIMGLRHPKLRVEGVQFHPESVLTDVGIELLRNFVTM